MDYKETFAKRLISLREQKNITQQELADELGITRQSLSLYEKAERTINIELLARIADFFNVSTDYLMGRTDIATLDESIQTACKVTGLSEEAIRKIQLETANYESNSVDVATLNAILTCHWFWNMFFQLSILERDSKQQLNSPYNVDIEFIKELSTQIGVSYNELERHIANEFLQPYGAIGLCRNDESCDLARYFAFQSIEKMNDLFDHRYDYKHFDKDEIIKYLHLDRLKKKEEDYAEHNPTQE